MDDWLDRFADALGVACLTPEDVDALLDLARVVAHGTERKNAPLATYLAGRSAGAVRPAAALSVAETLLDAGAPVDEARPPAGTDEGRAP